MKDPIADLHCHPSLKPHLNKGIGSIWDFKENPTVDEVFRLVSFRKLAIRGLANKMALKTQSNLDNCYLGNNRLIFCSIYPFEREFMRPDRPFKRASFFIRILLQILLRKKYKKKIDSKLLRVITGISPEEASQYLDQIHSEGTVVDYMQDFQREYDYLVESQGPRPKGPLLGELPEFRLAGSVEELSAADATNILTGIITVEGVHAFGRYPLHILRKNLSFEDLEPDDQRVLSESFRENIARVKDPRQTYFIPFFVTFAHHFNNYLSGHSKSFAGLFSMVFNQRSGLESGFSPLGIDVLRQLLERGPNRARILIDTKHMAPKVRQEYYQLVRDLRAVRDNVPIISSHSAVNGLESLEEAMQNNNSSSSDRRSYVSKFSINLTDEDIRQIFDSDGLIGICMHDGRMPGKKFKRKLRAVREYPEKAKRLYSQMFLTNVFHIVKVNILHIQNMSEREPSEQMRNRAWGTICLGSDNDGIVDPFNTYETAADLSDFRDKIIEALKTQDRPYMKDFRVLSLPEEEPMDFDTLHSLMMGQSPEQVAERIFYGNTRAFLQSYFTDAYRFEQAVV